MVNNDDHVIKNIIREMRQDLKPVVSNGVRAWGLVAFVLFILLLTLIPRCAFAKTFTYNELADAIYWAENSVKYPYGIRSINTRGDKEYARRITINTIRRNVARYKEYGHRNYQTYLSFLASRFAPEGAKNDPKGLNSHWKKNVIWFLNNPKAVPR